ncbi:myo-inosose-2 dehydratase [Methylobacterium soli]|uniref:Myo-inosose-2 dehydratase n=1 Tax=Methylobacterium soli TaxID=553447 RepID=A0A6L3SV66_9HYPH|nr:myo-inosose-2 dehydratase [Methylobacterium soli]KAB1077406.1 myo-inosose-2 dehydratase [Methylobacterium soli]GJE44429.1 Inosose dehydratase [Methylobacterium soli]
MAIRFGTNPIAWSNDDLPELGGDTPLETCLAEASQAGFAGIEKGNKFPTDPAALVDLLGSFGLDFISGWYGAELRRRDAKAELAAMRPHLDLLKACHCEVMVFAETSGTVQGLMDVPVADRPVMAEADWPIFLDRINELGQRMADEGVRIAFHHHMGTVIEAGAEIDRLMEGTGPEVGLLLDTGHLTFAGEDPAAIARRWAHRVNHVHAKDVRPHVLSRARAERWSFLRSVVEGVYTVPGDGCVDFIEALNPLAEVGYRGWLVVEAEQDPAKAHPLTYARLGYRHLAAAAKEAGFQFEPSAESLAGHALRRPARTA